MLMLIGCNVISVFELQLTPFPLRCLGVIEEGDIDFVDLVIRKINFLLETLGFTMLDFFPS